jgi:hypothetical protein
MSWMRRAAASSAADRSGRCHPPAAASCAQTPRGAHRERASTFCPASSGWARHDRNLFGGTPGRYPRRRSAYGVTTLRRPGRPSSCPEADPCRYIDGGRSAGPPPRRTRVHPRCGENTSRLDTESSSIGQSVDDFSAGQIRNHTGHCGGPAAGHKGSHLPELHQRGSHFSCGPRQWRAQNSFLRDSMYRGGPDGRQFLLQKPARAAAVEGLAASGVRTPRVPYRSIT